MNTTQELTLEQAMNNIRIILDKHIADKQTHLVIDQSFQVVKDELSRLNKKTE